MMALEDMKTLLDTTGYPVVYYAWPEKKAPALPYICFLTAYSNNFGADDRVYYPVAHYQIELYTRCKDPEAEGKVEQALSSYFWEKTETYLDTERCFQILYEVEV
ncbi:MAG: hypothetical protein ACLTOU_06085 [Acutalibacter sp.]|jgi:hypothetical protein|nr:MAG TPA: tail completion protein [Caudoviricetes sp.]